MGPKEYAWHRSKH